MTNSFLAPTMQWKEIAVLHNRDKPMINAATIADEMQTIIRRAAEPWAPGDSIKAAISRASMRTGLGHRRVRTLWYRQTHSIAAIEADTLRGWYRRWIASERTRLEARIADLETEWTRMESNG